MIAAIPHRFSSGSDSIAYWEDFLTSEEIQTILALPNWHTTETGQVGGNTTSGIGIVDKKLRASEIAWFVPTDETQVIWSKIVNIIAEVNATHFHYDLSGCYEPAQLTLYKAEDTAHYNWHTDSNPKTKTTPRKLSLSLLLSNPKDFEGGELQVKVNSDTADTLEQKQGRAWFFPSYTLHRVAPVTKGVRRSLVLWVGGPPFK